VRRESESQSVPHRPTSERDCFRFHSLESVVSRNENILVEALPRFTLSRDNDSDNVFPVGNTRSCFSQLHIVNGNS
jgi:hypothetical protein